MNNPNCDGNKCLSANGPVRVMPLGGGANLILCARCFYLKNKFRRERNLKLSKDCHMVVKFEILKWEDAKIYETKL